MITLDHHGGSEIVTDDIGAKVPVIDPVVTSFELAAAIERLADDRDLAFQLRKNALATAPAFSWPSHAATIDSLYREIMAKHR